jgi:hypothetical protein
LVGVYRSIVGCGRAIGVGSNPGYAKAQFAQPTPRPWWSSEQALPWRSGTGAPAGPVGGAMS